VLKEHAKLLMLFQRAGEIIGRKKLQKIVFIGKKLSLPFSERYKFHMFGPYSEELTLRVEELCNLGFLQEQKEAKNGYQQYRYSLTEEGQAFIKIYELEIPNLEPLVVDMNNESSRFLELVSTILYFEGLSKDEAHEKVQTVKKKQNYSEEEIEKAFLYIEKLNTIIH
jgi:uncharacterized protein YwgA